MNQYQEMLALLKASVSSIATAPDEEREGLLTKSFQEFEAALSPHIADALQEAFGLGMRGDLQKFVGGSDDDELAKASISQVAGMATLMQSIENQIQYLAVDPDGDDDLGPDNRAALGAWAEAGKQILAAMVADYAGAGEVETPADVGKFEEGRQLRKDHIKAITKVLKQRAEEMLSKADANAAADGSGASDGSDMDPLEVIGRLAAAILVQIDQLMPQDQSADDGSDQVAQPDATAQQPDATAQQPDASKPDQQPDSSAATAARTDQAVAEPPKKKPNPFAKADGATDLAKADGLTDPGAERLAKLEKDNAELRKALDLKETGRAPALRTVAKGADDSVVAIGAGSADNLQKRAEELSKMAPAQRTHELIKIAQSKPLKIVA